MSSLFKKGDKVRVLNGNGIENYIGGWIPDMASHINHICTIEAICDEDDRYGYILEEDENGYIFDERGLELVEALEADAKRFARNVRTIYDAFLLEKFDPKQALQLTLATINRKEK